MEKIPDEVLMAYADDALPPAERRRIDALLEKDAELARRLQPFIVTGLPLRNAITSALDGPVPERLIKTVLETPIKQAPARPGLIDSFFGKIFPTAPKFAAALAFCALAVVAGNAWFASQPERTTETVSASEMFVARDGGTVASGALLKALETSPMNVASVAGDGQSATPVVTFRDTEGRFCRQFKTKSLNESRAGYACRSDGGTWLVGFNAAVPDTASGDNVSRPADGGNLPELEDAINGVIASEAYSKDQESGLIRNGWRKEASN